ncbi:MAG: sigma-70 family RNA polymerase sigma factor [Acaryochloridaceae cyanobacterium RL_2_7]|nr:sigma-70 family RNA polymerase sigma factor [Acaryochloridaceae cyanobacterium RL_2_7]
MLIPLTRIFCKQNSVRFLRTEIQNLPDSLRQTFIDYYLHEKTTQEIAHRLQISENNVYKRLQKAREQLRHRLELYLNSNRYQQILEDQSLEAMTAVTDHSIISSPDTFRITSQCFALQPQLWFQSNSQLGWS